MRLKYRNQGIMIFIVIFIAILQIRKIFFISFFSSEKNNLSDWRIQECDTQYDVSYLFSFFFFFFKSYNTLSHFIIFKSEATWVPVVIQLQHSSAIMIVRASKRKICHCKRSSKKCWYVSDCTVKADTWFSLKTEPVFYIRKFLTFPTVSLVIQQGSFTILHLLIRLYFHDSKCCKFNLG